MGNNTQTSHQLMWGQLIIEELIRNGVTYFCLSPGSRSTPLTVAVARHPQAQTMIHFDERASAFHALGYAAATGRPVAVMTTSGTAVANVLPAVVEASKKKLPLIILSADRPPELRSTGAHQTIDQCQIFGSYVRFFKDVPVPTSDIPSSYVLTTVDQAVFRATGELRGPVHLNCMYREPLIDSNTRSSRQVLDASIAGWSKTDEPFTTYIRSVTAFDPETVKPVAQRMAKIKSGVIVVGKLPDEASGQAVITLGRKLGWPILPDLTSGLRLNVRDDQLIPYFHHALKMHAPRFDGVLHLGGRITSKHWYQCAQKNQPSTYIMVLGHPLRNDPLHNVTHRIQAPVRPFCEALVEHVDQRKTSIECQRLQRINRRIADEFQEEFEILQDVTEPSVSRAVSQLIPEDHALFLSNSLPIREFEQFAVTDGPNVTIGANRGASGIDGIIASAAGFSRGLEQPVTLMLGDLAGLYDLNALAQLKALDQPMTICLFNNDGGGIFSFLPIAGREKSFEKFFGTPHGLSFDKAADMFGLTYAAPRTMNEFCEVYAAAVRGRKHTLIEIRTNRSENFKYQEHLSRQIQIKTK